MKRPKISVIYPSRGRPEIANKTQGEWIWRLYDGCYGEPEKTWDVEFITSLDIDDTSKYHMIGKVIRNNNRSAIDAINNGAKVAKGDILIVISDDFLCFPAWDKYLIEALSGKYDYIVKTKDGLQPTLMTLPLMDRKYYERFGYIYNPYYFHMFSDMEMTAVGHMLGKVITLPFTFEHTHYSTGKFQKDEISIRNDSSWLQGETLFNERLKTNFGLNESEIVKPYSEIQWR